MTPRVLVVGVFVVALVTDAASWAVVTTGALALAALLYPAVARKVRARRG